MNSEIKIRDSLHGYISLTGVEKELLETDEVQRLRNITQLGATDRVYPSATHNRFSHSLGVLYLANEFATQLELSEEEIESARIAGLLHDTGHGPYSHTSEKVAQTYGIDHEDISCSIVDDYEDIIPNPDQVKDFIIGEAETNIISGVLDVDRMDYLMRDGYNTGVKHGRIDTDTLFEYATLTDQNDIAIQEKASSSLHEVLWSRLNMYNTVYTHEAVRAFDSLLLDALTQYAEDYSIEDLIREDEKTIYPKLIEYDSYQAFVNRDKPNTIVDIPRSEMNQSVFNNINSKNYKEINNELRNEVGVSDIYVKLPLNVHDDLKDVPIQTESGEFTTLSQTSTLSQYVSEYDKMDKFTVYSDASNKKEIIEACDRLYNVKP